MLSQACNGSPDLEEILKTGSKCGMGDMVKVRKKFNGTTEDRGRTTKKGNIRITLGY